MQKKWKTAHRLGTTPGPDTYNPTWLFLLTPVRNSLSLDTLPRIGRHGPCCSAADQLPPTRGSSRRTKAFSCARLGIRPSCGAKIPPPPRSQAPTRHASRVKTQRPPGLIVFERGLWFGA